MASWDLPGTNSGENQSEEKLESYKKVVGSLGFSVARLPWSHLATPGHNLATSGNTWSQPTARSVFWIVNDIMMTVLMDSWQFVQAMVNSYMITWLGLYGQSSLEKPVNNHAKDEKSNVEIKIRIQ